jgi:hypothetical protein
MPSSILEPMLATVLRFRAFSLDWSYPTLYFLKSYLCRLYQLWSAIYVQIDRYNEILNLQQHLNLQCGAFLNSRLNHVKPLSHLYCICTPTSSIQYYYLSSHWKRYSLSKLENIIITVIPHSDVVLCISATPIRIYSLCYIHMYILIVFFHPVHHNWNIFLLHREEWLAVIPVLF